MNFFVSSQSEARPSAVAYRKRFALSAACAIPFLVSQLSQAQQSNAAGDQTVVVTASRFAQSPSDVLSDNTVISSDEIRQSGAINLLDLLQQKRGLEIVTTGGPGTTSSVFLRGASNEQTVVLVDGARIGSSTLGGATWESIPLAQIDHVEIVYGPLSSLYGADAVGGVVQIFTRKGDGAATPSASVGFGSYNTRTIDASVFGSGANDNRLHYALGVARNEADGFSAAKPNAPYGVYDPDKDGYDKESASGQLSFDIAKGHEIGFGFLQAQNKAQFDNGPGYDDQNLERLNTLRLYARDQFLPNWTSNLQLSQAEDYVLATNGPYWQLYGETPSNRFKTTQTNLTWQNDLNIGTDVLQLLAERREEKIDSDTSGLSGQRDTNSIAASYQWKRDAQLAVFSLRDDDSNQYGSQTTGSLGYGYKITPAWRVNASYGTSFRAPTFNELYFPGYGSTSIKPEHGRDAEAGLAYDDGQSRLTAVVYRNRITDLVVYDSTCYCAKNVDQAVLTGLSLGGSTKLGDFSAHASLDFQDPHDETTHTVLARRAKQHGSVGIDYRKSKYQIGVDGIFSGKRYDDAANATQLGGYAAWNLHASMDIGQDWSVVGRWNNVLNRDYELAYGFATAASNLYLGLRYGFK
jgi:vitamin B12 transporter